MSEGKPELEVHRAAVLTRFRFADADNVISNPTGEELDASLFDSVGYINSFPPVSRYTVSEFLDDEFGELWYPVWYQCAGMFALATIVRDWTANGHDISFQEISVPDRRGDYEGMYSSTKDLVDSMLEPLKDGTQRVSRRIGPVRPPRPLRDATGLRGRSIVRFR